MADTPVSVGESTFIPNQTAFRRRLSRQNLRLDLEKVNQRVNNVRQSGFHCQFASPECRSVTNGTDCACNEDVIEEGKELFTNFLKDEISRSGLQERAQVLSPWLVDTPTGYEHALWAKAGRELREMADAFSKTKQRVHVKNRAYSMQLTGMDYSQFTDLLSELFLTDGITAERIVILFFFCSDLAICSLEAAAVDIFKRCIDWAVKFIVENICGWVKEHGGWCNVLNESVQFVGPPVIAALTVAALSLAIWHWLKRSL